MKSDELRAKFLEFFQSQRHKILPSDSLVPGGDPTVLFTSAGMNHFKKQFLGQDVIYPRVATCQKCLRTGDLDNVGVTCGHHTFFEMLGNFSFADYFKKEAIEWAWEFFTNQLGIPEEKLWVSTYQDDAEAYIIWRDRIKVPQDKIVKLGDKENFWPSQAKEKGPNGPCGPCSEIFFDQGREVGCGRKECGPACECNRFLEVWNLVFTQFERKPDGALTDLPHKNIDTGMGLERLAAVMQGVLSNFQTDLFQPLIKATEEICGSRLSQDNRPAFYAVSDHIRAITFAICDGVMPSNEERGYVIRNLIRRTLQHGRNLGVKKTFLYKLVPSVASVMRNPYPELEKRREEIALIIKTEEEKFLETLDQVLPKFIEILKDSAQKGKREIPAEIVFKFRDTYGLPWDVMDAAFAGTGTHCVMETVEDLIDEQRSRSRGQSQISDSIFTKERAFRGKGTFSRDTCELETEVVDVQQKAPDGKELEIVLAQTPFYPEQGGQVGDSGWLITKDTQVTVYDTKKIGDTIVHCATIDKGRINIADRVVASIDKKRRLAIARNHTATHLLQAALRKVLGQHVRQQGSLVSNDRLRFDFTHFKALDKRELERAEEAVNAYIRNNDRVNSEEMPLDKAKSSGALAFFGEKYGEKVRVVSIGDYSKEFCGGTHLEHPGEIGLFKIVSESSVASGIRRIEAVTGDFAYAKLKEESDVLGKISRMLGVPKEKAGERLEGLLSQVKVLSRRLGQVQSRLLESSLDGIVNSAEVIGGKKVIYKFMDGYDVDSLRKTVDLIKHKSPNSVIALTALVNGKLFLAAGITDDLVRQGLDAGETIKKVAPMLGAKGAGRPDFAQAGGGDAVKINAVEGILKSIMKDQIDVINLGQ